MSAQETTPTPLTDAEQKLGSPNVDANFARKLERDRAQLWMALAMYADPESYFAISFLFDRPCGAFGDDFSEDHGGDFERPMPGKLARATFAAIAKAQP